MAVRTYDEIMNGIADALGDDTRDEVLSLHEDIADTLKDYEARVKDSTDWKKKYEENDASWRQKYRDRFYHGAAPDEPEETIPEKKKYRFEDLFS